MRLFVATCPPASVSARVDELVEQLRSAESIPAHAVRWSPPAQWHVTLCFLGEVADPAPVQAGLAGLTSGPSSADYQAELGDKVVRLGRSALVVPVTGLDGLAARVAEAVGRPRREGRTFRGHLTVGRVSRQAQDLKLPARPERGDVPRRSPAEADGEAWSVTRVHLVRSHLHPDGSRYELLASVAM